MKILFCGTSAFAQVILNHLSQSHHHLLGIITQEDKTRGKERFHPAKIEALRLGLPIYQPGDINGEESLLWIEEKDPDLVVVAAYGQILKKKVLSLSGLGWYNVHGSLLPKYRGASPIHHAILHGETITGVTIQKVIRKLDGGPILCSKETTILPDETSDELSVRLSHLGASALMESLEMLEKGPVNLLPQKEEEATYAPSLPKEAGLIPWDRPAREVHNFIRSMTTWPGAWTMYKREGKEALRLILSRSQTLPEEKGSPGRVLKAKKELIIGCGTGAISVLEITPATGKKMKAQDFLNGYKMKEGDQLGHPEGKGEEHNG